MAVGSVFICGDSRSSDIGDSSSQGLFQRGKVKAFFILFVSSYYLFKIFLRF